MTCARRIADRDLDCLRFGTAIVRTFLVLGWQLDLGERRETHGGRGFGLATAGDEVAIAAAHAAKTQAITFAEGIDWNRQQNLVADFVPDIDLAALESDQIRILVVVR